MVWLMRISWIAALLAGLLAGPAWGQQWDSTGADIYYDTGNVGVGTSSPSRPLVVRGESVDGPVLLSKNKYTSSSGSEYPQAGTFQADLLSGASHSDSRVEYLRGIFSRSYTEDNSVDIWRQVGISGQAYNVNGGNTEMGMAVNAFTRARDGGHIEEAYGTHIRVWVSPRGSIGTRLRARPGSLPSAPKTLAA